MTPWGRFLQLIEEYPCSTEWIVFILWLMVTAELLGRFRP